MENLTTPFKGALIALIATKLIAMLGMSDAEANYVADAAFVLVTAALAYVVPKDMQTGWGARVLAWVLRRKAGAAAMALPFIVGALALGGCTAMKDGKYPAPNPQVCSALEAVLAPRRDAYKKLCEQAKDPLTDDKCLALDGFNAAILACWSQVPPPPAPIALT